MLLRKALARISPPSKSGLHDANWGHLHHGKGLLPSSSLLEIQTLHTFPFFIITIIMTAAATCSQVTMPDMFVSFLAQEYQINPYYETVKAEADTWMAQ